MRTLAGMALFTGLVFTTSCDKLESLADVKFDADLGADLSVLIPSGLDKSARLSGYEFSESATIDPKSNADIEEYFDKLKGFDVTEVSATVKSISDDPVVLTNGVITISSGKETATWTVPLFKVTQGNSLTLANEDGQWDKVNKILNEKTEFTASISGISDKNGVQFVIYLKISVKVTANPLN